MSRFEELLEKLEADIETVHGRRLAVTWKYRPEGPKETRWLVQLDSARGRVSDVAAPVAGHDGETPMRRLIEDYAARAHLIRERKGKR